VIIIGRLLDVGQPYHRHQKSGQSKGCSTANSVSSVTSLLNGRFPLHLRPCLPYTTHQRTACNVLSLRRQRDGNDDGADGGEVRPVTLYPCIASSRDLINNAAAPGLQAAVAAAPCIPTRWSCFYRPCRYNPNDQSQGNRRGVGLRRARCSPAYIDYAGLTELADPGPLRATVSASLPPEPERPLARGGNLSFAR